ncbi:MAG: hypothetical protein QM743_05715 [Chitinophagaceae bacterium]
MQSNMQEWPECVLEWVTVHPFSALSEAQQAVVLSCMSSAEYDAMHEVSGTLSVMQEVPVNAGPGRKQLLMDRFDARHQPAAPQEMRKKIQWSFQLWRAAAVALLGLCGWLTYERRSAALSDSPVTTIRDTVVRIKEVVVTNVVHDTFRLVATIATPVPEQKIRKAAARLRGGQEHAVAMNSDFADIGVVSPAEVNAVRNQSKGTSKKDDTLSHQYAFVVL